MASNLDSLMASVSQSPVTNEKDSNPEIDDLKKRLAQFREELDLLRRKNDELVAEKASLEELIITDCLTGLYNRRHFYRRLKEEMRRANRQRFPLSLLVVDLDRLKGYNDSFGHLEGDEALRGVAQAITASIRRGVDTGYRYGGDEFAVVLPHIDEREAAAVAERIRKTFNALGLKSTGLSIGLTQFRPEEEVDIFVGRADGAMYVAKNAGGNRVYLDSGC